MADGEKREIKKAVSVIIGVLAILFIIFLFMPVRVGLVNISYGEMLFRLAGLKKETRNIRELIEAMKHPDPKEQVLAISYLGLRDKDRVSVPALVAYIKNPDTHPAMKDIAVWSLGEMEATEAEAFLKTLIDNPGIDQYELNKAIQKINKEYTWEKRIKNQLN